MDIAVGLFTMTCDTIEHRADGIGYATCQHPSHSRFAQCFNSGGACEDNAPAEGDIKDHWKNAITLQIDGIKRNAQSGHTPNNAENQPAEEGIDGADARKDNGGIGTCNQTKDGKNFEGRIKT